MHRYCKAVSLAGIVSTSPAQLTAGSTNCVVCFSQLEITLIRYFCRHTTRITGKWFLIENHASSYCCSCILRLDHRLYPYAMAAPIPPSRTVSITYPWKPLPNTFVEAMDHMGEMGSALQLTYDHTLDRTASAHHIERCDLLEKRSDIFSSRPRLIAMGDAINATNTNQTTLVYGDRWRKYRKLMVCHFDLFTSAVLRADSIAHGCWLSSRT
jgi:hypothetical protein